jgi:hypothetical protein
MAKSRCADWGHVDQGASVRVAGLRGQFVFRKVDRNGDIEVFGGASGRAMFRTFSASRVTVKLFGMCTKCAQDASL